jgi:hypothetical protein
MRTTTMKIQNEVRNHLARVAAEDYAGATLSDALAQLLAEHEKTKARLQIAFAYAHLRSNPDQWSSYLGELDEWDRVAARSGGE